MLKIKEAQSFFLIAINKTDKVTRLAKEKVEKTPQKFQGKRNHEGIYK